MRFALDTSCLIPLVALWHEKHRATLEEVETRLRRREKLLVPVHVVLESYSVLTRLPESVRVVPKDCESVLRSWLKGPAEVAPGLPVARVLDFLHDQSLREVTGGRIYDAVIAESSHSAGATVLLTWNRRHFEELAPEGLEVREPGSRT